MTEDDQQWQNALLQLCSIGYNNGFLGEKNERELIFTSDSLKMSLTIKVEQNNIVPFCKQNA